MLVLVERIANPNVIAITPTTRQKPFLTVASLRSFTIQTRRIATTTTAITITDGLRIFSAPPLSGITTY